MSFSFSEEASQSIVDISDGSKKVLEESKKEMTEKMFVARLKLLGAIIWSFSEIKKEVVKGVDSINLILLLMFFLQGAEEVLNQILSGKYVLASAGLKQEMEMVARGNELLKNKAREGKVSNIDNYPGQVGPVYGMINEVAHISKLEVLGSFISKQSTSGSTSISCVPALNKKALQGLYVLHFFNCERMASLAVDFLRSKNLTNSEKLDEVQKEIFIAHAAVLEIVKSITETESISSSN